MEELNTPESKPPQKEPTPDKKQKEQTEETQKAPPKKEQASPPPASQKKRLKKKRKKSHSHRLLALIQILAGLCIFIAINKFSAGNFTRWDLSDDKSFALSELTKSLIRESLPKIINTGTPKIIVVARKNSPHYARLRVIVEEYERLGAGRIKAEFVDPIRDPNRTTQLSEAYGHTFTTDIIIIDGRNKASTNPSHIRFLKLDDLIVYRTDQRKQRRIVGYQMEDQISTALLAASEGQARQLLFLSDKSYLSASGDTAPWETLAQSLQKLNIQLVSARISELEEIPKNIEGIVLVAPQYDLDTHELQMLEEYWKRPKSSILLLLDPLHKLPHLHGFIRKQGIRLRNDRIMMLKNGRPQNQVRATFTEGPLLNEGLYGQATLFEGRTCSIDIQENDPDLLARQITSLPLLEAAADYWGETNYQTSKNIQFNLDEDYGPPLHFGAAIIKGNATNDLLAEQTSRMVILSNVDFLNPKNLRAEHLDFLKNSTNWLIGREQLLGVGPLPIQTYKLNLISTQVSFLNRLALFILPVFFLIIGLFVWNLRKS